MIQLKNVNKYFNKNRKNQIHVINNISLNLEKNGFIALLGPSGCGKTTLLNTIGGLDKVNKGQIYIDNKKISSKMAHKVDKIRNLNVGYIFQDYKLIENLSVYDNIALVLTMIGIKDKDEIKKRVEYVLDKVGMLRYKKRPAAMLSGGERQRVGIARAIVKDPNIILADEPTGNLDSKNSLEIMKIIKAISKDKLVLLVTHEQSLAKFYADRIIEIQDGAIINDYENKDSSSLDYEIENSFYLKDFKYNKAIKEDQIDLNVYTNEVNKIKLDIVIKNGNIYIKSNNHNKVEVVDDNSSIEFIDDHYKKIDKKDIEKLEFDFKNIINNNFKKKYSSILNPVSMIIKGFKKLFDYSILKKILLGGFFLAGMFIMYSVSSIGATFKINEEDFVRINRKYLTVEQGKNKINEYLEYEKMEAINYILPGDSLINLRMPVKDYYQTANYEVMLNASLSSISMIKESDLITGVMPNNKYEVVVDKNAIDNMLKSDDTFKMYGLFSYRDILDRELKINGMPNFKIVGITDLKSPSIYFDESLFINVLASSSEQYYDMVYLIYDYELFESDITLKKGRLPVNDYEIIVNIEKQDYMPLNKTIDDKINGTKLKVVGYYASANNYDYYFTNYNTIKYKVILEQQGLTIYPNDPDKVVAEFKAKNLNIKDSYAYSKAEYMEAVKDMNQSTVIISSIILLISVIEIYLMIRSSFLSRIKEIGIFRAIGVKKSDIYKMFYGEIFAITTLASLTGILFMAYILNALSGIPYLGGTIMVNSITLLTAIVFTYAFNLIVGLIPVFNVVRKTPASILARTDLE